MKAVSVHQSFRTLRTFFSWCVDAGLSHESPMRGLVMWSPTTLPRILEDEDVRRLLLSCLRIPLN